MKNLTERTTQLNSKQKNFPDISKPHARGWDHKRGSWSFNASSVDSNSLLFTLCLWRLEPTKEQKASVDPCTALIHHPLTTPCQPRTFNNTCLVHTLIQHLRQKTTINRLFGWLEITTSVMSSARIRVKVSQTNTLFYVLSSSQPGTDLDSQFKTAPARPVSDHVLQYI